MGASKGAAGFVRLLSVLSAGGFGFAFPWAVSIERSGLFEKCI
jgi:hypothetical protein